MKKSQFRNISGPYIRHYRKASSPPVSQKDLARCIAKLGAPVAQAEISRIENRRMGVTDLQLLAFARCLNVTVAQLFGEVPVKKLKV